MGLFDFLRRKNIAKSLGPNVKPSKVLQQNNLGPYRSPPVERAKPNIHMRDMTQEQRTRELLKTRILGPLYSRMKLASPFPVKKKK